MNRVENKLVLVTGASSGIGEACAKRFAACGASLILVARREERLLRLQQVLASETDVSVHAHRVDVRDRESVEGLAAQLEKTELVPDILVNNAGLSRGLCKFQEGEFVDWDEMIDTNVKGLLNVSRCIVPMMLTRNSGHIVNVGSIAGHVVYPGGNVYNATKYAVRALTEAMNIDLVGTNIRVSSVDPGATETEFSQVRFHGDKKRAKAVYDGFEPLTGDDIADAILYVVNTPAHVNVANLVILPTAQRNPYVVHVKGGAGRKR
ncbi:MAG: SDR family NAD(P)-dependent oxidoreductase [Candidatus Krumholzibacteria bacterium]|nr:SDR family NAD(P)-dependent oxidoreductase [Candidatus Krumholzibacteria bacterium]